MKSMLSPFIAGALFGTGLVVSGMTDPAKVKGFLDFAGHWDMSLLWVMVGAIAIHAPIFWHRRRKDPALMQRIAPSGPPKRVDGQLLLGSGIFGIGWGLAGVCPGPAVAALSTGAPMVILTLSIVCGIWLHDVGLRAWIRRRSVASLAPPPPNRDATCVD